MRELAVQSASDTNESTVDRNALQQEFDQLKREINDTSGKTKFNDQSLIDGTFAKSITTATTTNSAVNFAWADDRVTLSAINVTFTTMVGQTQVTAVSGTSSAVGSFFASSSDGSVSASFVSSPSIQGQKYNGIWNVILSDGKVVAENQRTGERIVAELSAISAGANASVQLGPLGWIDLSSANNIQANSYQSVTGQFEVKGAIDEVNAIYKHIAQLDTGEQVVVETGQTTLNFANAGITLQLRDAIVAESSSSSPAVSGTVALEISKTSGKSLTIQTGANEGDNLALNLAKLDAYSLGISGANIANRMDASVAITQVNTALNIVSTQRAALGALQNRLEYKISNLDVGAENLQAAESRIRDADMAKEMTTFTKNNILFQASTAMLAQANALPQGVLQLLG